MMLDPEDPVVRAATFGQIVQNFIDGPIGAYIQARCQEEELEAVKNLITVDSDDYRSIRKWQTQAQVAGKIIEWLMDAIQAGHNALDTLKEEHGD